MNLDAILNNVNKVGDCLIWKGAKTLDGYGQVRFENKMWRVPRLIWKLKMGIIPFKLLVCHKCDNPSCINIEHLFLGTHMQNSSDCVSKKRNVFFVGEKHSRTKLTEIEVKTLRALYSIIECKNLSILFKTPYYTIFSIVKRRSWKHLKPLTEEEIYSIRNRYASQYT